MLEAKEKQIGNHTYLVRQLPATQAHKVFIRIGKILGPAIGGGLDGIKTSFSEDAASGLGKAVKELFDRATPEELDALIKEFAAMSEVDGKPLKSIFDLHFAGKLTEMYKWIGFALEANYSDFLDVFKAPSAALIAKVASSWTSPKTSTGQSGASSSNNAQL